MISPLVFLINIYKNLTLIHVLESIAKTIDIAKK